MLKGRIVKKYFICMIGISLVSCTVKVKNEVMGFSNIKSVLSKALDDESLARKCDDSDKLGFEQYFKKSDESSTICFHLIDYQSSLSKIETELSSYETYRDWMKQGKSIYYKSWRMKPGILHLTLINDRGIAIFKFDATKF